jgi:ATP-dependent Lon protease
VVLDLLDVKARLENLFEQLEREVDILNVDKKIRGRVKRQMEKNQRDFYLNEQVKAIQKELGEGEEGADIEEIEKKIKLAKMPKEARKKAEAELKKLKLMSPMSAEATVVRNYIDVLTGLPWSKKTKIKHDLAMPKRCSTKTTTGWTRSRTASLNTLRCSSAWTRSRRPSCAWWGRPAWARPRWVSRSPRPPAASTCAWRWAACATRPRSVGHRRTYIGAMPGKVLQSLNKVGVRNPLFLLDEIDKLGMDFRGDPSSALLEVLDPEQNHTFGDHYVEVDFDLSDVMFVATSNSMNIPPALLDRMEVIRLSGYTEDEKTNIAMKYLLPKQLKNNGVKDEELSPRGACATSCATTPAKPACARWSASSPRSAARWSRAAAQEDAAAGRRDADNLNDFLGVRKLHLRPRREAEPGRPGGGLAWTEVGGDLLTIEGATMPGKGVITRTGFAGRRDEGVGGSRPHGGAQPGTHAWASRTRCFEKRDIHIHVPDGATPKDGPSAGAAMTTAFVSALTGIPVRAMWHDR